MNRLTFLSQASQDIQQYVPDLQQAYIILVVVVPVMIGLLLLIAFMMLIGVVGLTDRINEVRRLLEDIFSEKLNAIDEADRLREESEITARLAAREERRKSVKPMTKNHRIIIGILAALIPILLVVLIIVSVIF